MSKQLPDGMKMDEDNVVYYDPQANKFYILKKEIKDGKGLVRRFYISHIPTVREKRKRK